LEDESKTLSDKGTDVNFIKRHWKISKNEKSETPQQDNGYDCGVFIIMYAYFLTENLSLSFSQKDIALFRERLCAAVLKGNMEYPFEIQNISENLKMESEIDNKNLSSSEAEYFEGTDGNYDDNVVDMPNSTIDGSEEVMSMSYEKMESEIEIPNTSNYVANQISNNCCVC
jgi:hypothetical protein